MLLVQEDPLVDTTNLQMMLGVMVKGNWFSKAYLQEKLRNLSLSYDN